MRTVICLSGFMALAFAASAGVYDDTVVWWHFDHAPDYVDGAVNVVQPGDIRDQRNWSATSGIGIPTQITGVHGGPVWTNVPVACPAGGRAYGDRSLHFRQMDDGSSFTADTIKFGNLSMEGSATFVMRLRWDGVHLHPDKLAWLYNHSLDWNGERGWSFGVRNEETVVYLGKTDLRGPSLASNVWHDVAIVITDNGSDDLLEFYVWAEGGTLKYTRRVTDKAVNSPVTMLGVLGSEAATGSSNRKAFVGMVNHFALWNRALSRDEVMEALCFPQPLLQVGMENGSADELGAANVTTAVFRPGDAWHTMPRSITQARGVTFEVPITGVKTNCNYVFHVKSAACVGGDSAKLLLSVNGQADAARDALRIRGGGDVFWPVAKERLLDGNNTFALTVAGGPATEVVFDWLSLEGGWQVGYDDNKKDEFSSESNAPDDFYVTDPNWKNMEAALARHSSMETNTVLHFALSPELAGNTDVGFTYTTRIIQQNRGTDNNYPPPPPPYPFSIHLNGVTVFQTNGVENGTLVPVPIPAGLVRAGMNNINITLDTDTLANWIQFDFHRFEPVMWELPNFSGTTLLVQ